MAQSLPVFFAAVPRRRETGSVTLLFMPELTQAFPRIKLRKRPAKNFLGIA